jgi:hypothetical protein
MRGRHSVYRTKVLYTAVGISYKLSVLSGTGVKAESLSPGAFFPFSRLLPRVNPPGDKPKKKNKT